MDRIECQWCKAQNEMGRTNCTTCGAPLDKKDLVTDSGWAEAPRLRDMTEFRFSSSTCQIEGEIVPVAEIALAQGDSVFFEHHVMLWKEPQVPMSALNTGGGIRDAFLQGHPSLERRAMFVTADAPFDATLVVTQQLVPGWRAAIDGHDAETFRDGIFRAVRLTRGHHEVAWRYRPMSLVIGSFITFAALARLLLSFVFVKR